MLLLQRVKLSENLTSLKRPLTCDKPTYVLTEVSMFLLKWFELPEAAFGVVISKYLI